MLTRERFIAEVGSGSTKTLAVPLATRLLADQLTPVLAYRRLVAGDERSAPSFLLESVEGGERQGRYSILGAQPILHVTAKIGAGNKPTTTIRDFRHARTDRSGVMHENPLAVCRAIAGEFELRTVAPANRRDALPTAFLGGWVGYAGYDTVRLAEAEKLASVPRDDRGLPDLDFAFYDGVVVFDHVDKLVWVIQIAMVEPGADAGEAFDRAAAKLARRIDDIQRHSKPLPAGVYEPETGAGTGHARPLASNMTREEHAAMVARAKEYIRAGDIFQVVLGQRFERVSTTDPFDVYRALRAVNPSPYMVYLQASACILVASSPEILCRVRRNAGGGLEVTNRPLAGTRKRGATPEEDAALEKELLADPKERAEHIMLVDLGRNDVGVVARAGTIRLDAVMEIERYSHVMHISSTVTGELRAGLDAWDALAAALPVGTISGAPKVRAMQIIDELEPIKRGAYGGGMGCVGLDGQMDIALTLRTMVVPHGLKKDGAWTYHLQASGGIVADSEAGAEYQETVNKSAALARAIDVAERSFG
ncbi:MAG: anthranilate synthase component I [Phycisphaerales bacterium]|nr:anthranilate synthase component I [Phycisphaerales bacterium]